MRLSVLIPALVGLVAFNGLLAAAESHWGYEGEQAPNYWLTDYEHCGGKSQSPIDLALSEIVYDSSYGPIDFQGYDSANQGNFRLRNNGHTVQMDVMNSNHVISGGKLPAQYKLVQFHFHWGNDNQKGSEHLINGHQYPLEMHLVHYNTKYTDIGEAVNHPNGVAVVGVMFEVGRRMHQGLDNVVRNIDSVKYKDQETDVNTFALADLLPHNPEKYFRYSGSLTTPPCSETVVWTVLNNPVSISQAQIDKFREVMEGSASEAHKNLVNNFRPPQPLFGRRVYSSFEATQTSEPEEWHWSYKNRGAPSFWPIEYEACAGRRQSPVDIPISEVQYDASYGPVEFHGYDSDTGTTFLLHNNGHSVQVDIDNATYMISGGKLPAQYKLAQFHFHWGSDNDRGSEHLINGRQYPLEMHLVHYNSKYESLSEAVAYPDGIVVLGVMFEIGESHSAMNNIINKLAMVRYKEQEVSIGSFPLMDILPKNTDKYFTYSGSLTTPGCSETVIWVVLKTTVKISQDQINEFRETYHEKMGNNTEHLVDNYRPPQPLFGRTIYSNFELQQTAEDKEMGGNAEPVEYHWGYKNRAAPSYWPMEYDDCVGERQSPIDIPLSETVYDQSFGPIQFEGYDSDTKTNFRLHNNGHSIQVDIDNATYMISGGKLPAQYKLAQFHFHWGSDNNRGSEHLINGHQYPLEMHLVHFDQTYKSLSEAVPHPDGIVVLGVMFEIEDESNSAMNNIVQNLAMVRYKEQEVNIGSFPLMDILPNDTDKYFTYSGSLTTPGCSETVTWVVFKHPVKISQDQIDEFRESYDGEEGQSTEHLVNNFRPAQPLFGRTVYSNFETLPMAKDNDKEDGKMEDRKGEKEGEEKSEWHWGYEKKMAPDYWLFEYDQCAGRSQSPIDIPLSETTFDATYGPMLFKGYNSNMGDFKLHNNGHSVQVDIVKGEYVISGGNLPAQYQLAQFHFHWGSVNNRGSEHLINGQQYPLEMHLVHYNRKYDGLSKAVGQPEGIAVFAVMFEIGFKADPVLNKIVQNLAMIRHKEQQSKIATFRLADLLPEEPEKYFRYIGSLTTPPCSESVIWTVFKNPIMMSQAQIDEFRLMYKGKVGNTTNYLVDNYREPQPLFGRRIYSSFTTKVSVAPSSSDAHQMATPAWCIMAAAILIYCKATLY